MKISNIGIGHNNRVFIIAELSANHNGSKKQAIASIRAAKKTGADAIKLQTYTPNTITIDSRNKSFTSILDDTVWAGYNLFDLYKEAYTPWEWHEELFRIAREEGIICFSSPFDQTAVDFLETFNPPAYKIASFEITDIPLIERVASIGKPIIFSTGIATAEDIELALDACMRVDNDQIAILKCTSSYPAPLDEANMIMIGDYVKRFNVVPGVSDHTIGNIVPIVATAMGAKIIEKHFIIDRSIGGPDASFSMNEVEFASMVKAVRKSEQAIGVVDYSLTDKQIKSRSFSRSLYVVEDIKIGERFTGKNIRSIRPGFGIHPKYYHAVLKGKAKCTLERGTPLKSEDIIW